MGQDMFEIYLPSCDTAFTLSSFSSPTLPYRPGPWNPHFHCRFQTCVHLQEAESQNGSVTGLAFALDGCMLVSSSSEGHLVFQDTREGVLFLCWEGI